MNNTIRIVQPLFWIDVLLHLDIVTAAFVFSTNHGNDGVKVHTFKVWILFSIKPKHA